MMTPTMYSSNAHAYAPRIQSPLAVPLPSSSRPRDQWEVDNWVRTPPTFGPGPDFTYDTRFYDVDPLDPSYDLTLDPPAHGDPPPTSLADYLLPERKLEMQGMLEVANAEPMFAEGGESLVQEQHARVALGRPPLRPDLRIELELQQQGLDAFQACAPKPSVQLPTHAPTPSAGALQAQPSHMDQPMPVRTLSPSSAIRPEVLGDAELAEILADPEAASSEQSSGGPPVADKDAGLHALAKSLIGDQPSALVPKNHGTPPAPPPPSPAPVLTKSSNRGGGRTRYTRDEYKAAVVVTLDVNPYSAPHGKIGASWDLVQKKLCSRGFFLNSSAQTVRHVVETLMTFHDNPEASSCRNIRHELDNTTTAVEIAALLDRLIGLKQFSKDLTDEQRHRARVKDEEDKIGGDAIRSAAVTTLGKRKIKPKDTGPTSDSLSSLLDTNTDTPVPPEPKRSRASSCSALRKEKSEGSSTGALVHVLETSEERQREFGEKVLAAMRDSTEVYRETSAKYLDAILRLSAD